MIKKKKKPEIKFKKKLKAKKVNYNIVKKNNIKTN